VCVAFSVCQCLSARLYGIVEVFVSIVFVLRRRDCVYIITCLRGVDTGTRVLRILVFWSDVFFMSRK
jgi:hypothetical protein